MPRNDGWLNNDNAQGRRSCGSTAISVHTLEIRSHVGTSPNFHDKAIKYWWFKTIALITIITVPSTQPHHQHNNPSIPSIPLGTDNPPTVNYKPRQVDFVDSGSCRLPRQRYTVRIRSSVGRLFGKYSIICWEIQYPELCICQVPNWWEWFVLAE
jgi:hypothetical protein